MRFAARGGVLRRVPSFEKLEMQRSGRLALKLATAGVIVSTERELKEGGLPGWPIPMIVAPLGVDAAAYDAVEPANRARHRGAAARIAHRLSLRSDRPLSPRRRCFARSRCSRSDIRTCTSPSSAPDRTTIELRMHAAALGVGPVVSFLGPRDDEQRVMRAAAAGWVVSSGDAGACACLDFMALRVPVIAERSPLTQHYVADGITGLLLAPGDASYTASAVAAFLSGEEKRVAMGNAGRTRVAARLPRDGDDRRIRARGERGRRPDEVGDDVTAVAAVAQPTFAHRAEYAALRGAVAAIERLSFSRAGRIGERIGGLGFAPLRIRRAVVERQLARRVSRARRGGHRAHRARGVRASRPHEHRDGDSSLVQRRRDHRAVRGGARLGSRRAATRAAARD